MKINNKLSLTLIIVASVFAFLYIYNQKFPVLSNQTQGNNDTITSDNKWIPYTFEKIGLSFSVPTDLTVSNDESDENMFILYIQRETYPNPKYYQLYVTLQPSNNMDYDKNGIKNQLLDGSKDLIIDGYQAIQGQYKGERGRYVTFIFTNKGMLTLATSQPTIENEQLTNSILATFRFSKDTTDKK